MCVRGAMPQTVHPFTNESETHGLMSTPATLTQAQFERWLSTPRAGRYLRAADGDIAVAVALYDWNGRVAASAFTVTCHAEVALRNAYDRQLSAAVADWTIEPELRLLDIVKGYPATRDEQRALNEDSKRKVATAKSGLGLNPSHGRVVAALMFGFWAKLTVPRREPTYWTLMLKNAFPKGTSRGEVHATVSSVNGFRNRLAHNEPVFSATTGLADRLADVHRLFDLVDPAANQWVTAHSTVAAVVDTCPVPGLITL